MLKRILAILVTIFCAVIVVLIWVVWDHGPRAVRWQDFKTAKVSFDEYGVPTIKSNTWTKAIEAQGYVHASERLWQMDLTRRAADGRLSEWLGSASVDHDLKRIQQNWRATAVAAVATLTDQESKWCRKYADGVNRFIVDAKRSWGIEYTLLGVAPDPWTCADSMLTLMTMADDLSGKAELELRQSSWRDALSDEWQAFLFPRNHPWAQPYFGSTDRKGPSLPPVWQYLPPRRIDAAEPETSAIFNDPTPGGSNAWAWSDGKTTLLATDPHLGQRVPQLWYASRLIIDDDKLQVAGASIPGLPGIVIGSNGKIAWSFTNLGDDVDDFLEEVLDTNRSQYLAYEDAGRQHWRRIIKKTLLLKIKGEPDREVETWATHRGPLLERPGKKPGDKRFFSRQWLGFSPGVLHLPTVDVNRAKNWGEFNAALDRMRSPGQVAIYADTSANIGFRVTGIDVKRKNVSGHVPLPAVQGEWTGIGSPGERKRFYLSRSASKKTNFIANANAQIWEDGTTQHWASDDRRRRIMGLLASKSSFTVTDMEAMQLDTHSEFAKSLLNWVADHTAKPNDAVQKIFDRWKAWNGESEGDELSFTDSRFLENRIITVLLTQIRNHFWSDGDAGPFPYESPMRRAWLLKVISTPKGTLAFGIDESELSEFLISQLMTADHRRKPNAPLYSAMNVWAARHPLESIPIVGKIFSVGHQHQFGSPFVVRVELPKHGASLRMVWDLSDLAASRWAFPVGQSGHVGSPHYRDLQRSWVDGKKRMQIWQPRHDL